MAKAFDCCQQVADPLKTLITEAPDDFGHKELSPAQSEIVGKTRDRVFC